MAQAAGGPLIVIADTSVLLNFLRIGRLDLLTSHRDYRFAVTEHVIGEITDVQQSAAFAVALNDGLIDTLQVADTNELQRIAQLNVVLGIGESSAIAVAESRGLIIAMDEGGRARREINNGPCRNRLIATPGILLSLIHNATITVIEADAIKLQLEGFRFRMTFGSFADLI